MRTFQDAMGNTWQLQLNVDALKRIKASGIDLCAMLDGDPPLLVRLENDATLLADVVWAWIETQTKTQPMTRQAFDLSLNAEMLGELVKAFWGELSDFFQRLNPRIIRAMTMAQGGRGENSQAASGSESTSSPEASGAIPAPTPSGN
jgi:hypothetical protein